MRTQWRVGGMGIIGLDYPAVYLEAQRLEIEISNCLMAKIKALEAFELERMHRRDDHQKPTVKP